MLVGRLLHVGLRSAPGCLGVHHGTGDGPTVSSSAPELALPMCSYVEDQYRWDDLMVRYEDLLERVVDAFDARGLRGSRGR